MARKTSHSPGARPVGTSVPRKPVPKDRLRGQEGWGRKGTSLPLDKQATHFANPRTVYFLLN